MSKYSDSNDEYNLLTEQPFDIIGQFIIYKSYWKWFILSLIVCITTVAIYMEFTLPTYEVKTSILFKDDEKGSGSFEMNIFKEMSILTQKNNVDNELELLNNSLIVQKAVYELGLYTSYTEINSFEFVKKLGINNNFSKFGQYQEKVLYGDECPILISMSENSLKKLTTQLEFNILIHPYGVYEFSGTYNGEKYSTSASISDNKVILPFGEVSIKRGEFRPKVDMTVEVVIQNPTTVTYYILSQLKMKLKSKTTSVVDLSFICSNVNLGKDFLKKFIETYNQEGINEQIEMANKTSQLIEDHLMSISKELSNVETLAENYKQAQGITDITSQSDIFNRQTTDVEQKKLELETQLTIVSNLNDYIQNKENKGQLIPSNSGIKSSGLNELIVNYNKLILDRNKLSHIASSSNRAMIDYTNQIESMYSTIQSSLQNEKNNLQIAHRDLLSKYTLTNARIMAIPRQERQYSDIKRQQGVKEGLFLYLLQKKEEKYINMSTVEPNSKLIDNVRSSGPIWPNKMLLLFSSIILGLIIPAFSIKISDLLRYQIDNKEELEEISNVPVLGEIPKTNLIGNVFIKENNTDSFTEMIRLLRTNLLFVMENKDKKVINILSSISGEGKTFTSINLAISLALLEKKVLIIELDIRKPKLAKYLNIENKTGITLFLSGQINQNELVKPSGIHRNLSIITSGTIPPNPNELLAKPALDKLITNLGKDFDYIVIDTAPVGVVSDSFLLNRFADVNLYVVRANYTTKKDIEDATNLYKKNKIKNMYFVLNNVDMNKHSYRYGYGRKYGYGYGKNKKQTYGYSSET
ncbi:MAG: polysaccharide biosynthesis tyrosine autokinase [Paludibacter sp.]